MQKDYTRFVELSNKGAKELGFADTGAMWRSKYDMPPDDFAKELDRLWDQVRPLYLVAARLRAHEAAREVRRRRAARTGRFRRICSATCGRRSGRTSIRLVAPAKADPGYRPDQDPRSSKTIDADRDGEVRRGLLHVAGLRAAAADVLGALAVRQAARSRSGVPRQRLGRRQRRRPAHQDVHRHRRRRISRRSTTSWATTSISAPTTSSRSSSATARTTASTKRSATPSRCRSRPSIW